MGENHEHQRAVAWLRLLRLPNFVTVPGDPLAGFALASGFTAGAAAWPVAAAVGASLCIYAAGMFANDYFDLDEDRRFRPERPLPAGQVKPAAVLLAALATALAGVGLASLAGLPATIVAGVLVLAVVAYDAGAKRVPVWGPINMGICRGLSLLLGAAAAGPEFLRNPAVCIAAAGLVAYIAAVTAIAAAETATARLRFRRWLPGLSVGACFGALYVWARPDTIPPLALAGTLAALALVWAAWCGHRLSGRVPATVTMQTVGKLIRGLLLIQAAFVATHLWPGAALAAVLLAGWPLGAWMGRHFYAS